jgi:hypothetical protein
MCLSLTYKTTVFRSQVDGYIIPFIPGSWHAKKRSTYVVARCKRVVASDIDCMRGGKVKIARTATWWYRTRHVRVDDGEIWGYRGVVVVSHHYAMGLGFEPRFGRGRNRHQGTGQEEPRAEQPG